MARVKIVTRKDLCTLTGVKPATMRKAISRKSLVESSPGEINVYNTKNQQWIVDYCDKNAIDYKPIFAKGDKPAYKIKKPTIQKLIVDSESEEKDINVIDSDANEFSLLNKKKKQREVEIKGIEAQLKKLELERKKAKVLPVDFVGDILNLYVKVNLSSIKTNGHKLIGSIVDQFGGDNASKLLLIKQFDQTVSDTFKHNHEIISKDCQDMAKKYALDRNW